MAVFKTLEKILRLIGGNYIVLEEWSDCYDPESEKAYVEGIIKHLKSCYPELEILSIKKSNNIESRFVLYLAFKGYEIKISPNVDLNDLKNTCMILEVNEDGQRVSDIDIYYQGRRISRKNQLEIKTI